MTAHDRRRVRRIVEAPDGTKFPLELPTGTVLHPGQELHRDGSRAYVVAAAPEDVLVIRPRDLAEAARMGHLIGNLHRDLEADGGEVVALAGAPQPTGQRCAHAREAWHCRPASGPSPADHHRRDA